MIFFALLSGLFGLAIISNTLDVAARVAGHPMAPPPRTGVIAPGILSLLFAVAALASVPWKRVPPMVLGTRTFSVGGRSIEFTAPPRLEWREGEHARLLVVHDGSRGFALNPWLFSTPEGWSILHRLAECSEPGPARDQLLALTSGPSSPDQRRFHPATMVALGALGLLFLAVIGLLIWVRIA